jgi:hypothetical protein
LLLLLLFFVVVFVVIFIVADALPQKQRQAQYPVAVAEDVFAATVR